MSSNPQGQELPKRRAGDRNAREETTESPQLSSASQYRSIQPRLQPHGSNTVQHGGNAQNSATQMAGSHRTPRGEVITLRPTRSSLGSQQGSRTPSRSVTFADAGPTSSNTGSKQAARLPAVRIPTLYERESASSSSQRSDPTPPRSGHTTPYFPFQQSRGPSREVSGNQLEPFLLGLSIETRYRIYKLLLVEDYSMELSTRKNTRTIKAPALLHVNHQIREEAGYIWYRMNHFTVKLRHGEIELIHDFLAAVASFRSPVIGRLDITLSTCFQCNDLVAVAALLIASNIPASIKCVRSTYHIGDPRVMPCNFDVTQAISAQNFRPSVATALLQCSDAQLPGAGFVIEDTTAIVNSPRARGDDATRDSLLGYTPTYNVNLWIRSHIDKAMGSVGLLLQ